MQPFVVRGPCIRAGRFWALRLGLFSTTTLSESLFQRNDFALRTAF